MWYSFYGTLANPEFLAELLGIQPPTLIPARIHGGKLRTWGEKYNALIDSPGQRVEGWRFEVQSREQEDKLRADETGRYEAVRVQIVLKEKGKEEAVKWCVFRFVGEEGELDRD